MISRDPDSSNPPTSYRTVRNRGSSLQPSPENLALYRQINIHDDDIVALAESIQEHGLREPLIVTADNFVFSGHRRYAALLRIEQKIASCRVLPVRREDMTTGQYVALLREGQIAI